jgi:hypothetical protein
VGSPNGRNGRDFHLLPDKKLAPNAQMMVVVVAATKANISLMWVPKHSGETGVPKMHSSNFEIVEGWKYKQIHCPQLLSRGIGLSCIFLC